MEELPPSIGTDGGADAAALGDPAPPTASGRSPGDWYPRPAQDRHVAPGFVLTRLTSALAELDHEALLSSSSYLRSWSDSDWPVAGFPLTENRRELAWHDEEHAAHIAFTYSVLDPEEQHVLGCIYVRPLRDMLRTRDVEPPAGPGWPGGDTPCVRGWVRRDRPPDLEFRLVTVVTTWLTGPDWSLRELWWTAASDDERQLSALDGLGWTRTLSTRMLGSSRAWVFRAPEVRAGQVRPSS